MNDKKESRVVTERRFRVGRQFGATSQQELKRS